MGDVISHLSTCMWCKCDSNQIIIPANGHIHLLCGSSLPNGLPRIGYHPLSVPHSWKDPLATIIGGMKLSKTSNPQISEYFASNQRTTCSTFPMVLVHTPTHIIHISLPIRNTPTFLRHTSHHYLILHMYHIISNQMKNREKHIKYIKSHYTSTWHEHQVSPCFPYHPNSHLKSPAKSQPLVASLPLHFPPPEAPRLSPCVAAGPRRSRCLRQSPRRHRWKCNSWPEPYGGVSINGGSPKMIP